MLMWTLLLLLQYNDSIHKVQGDCECGRIDRESLLSYLDVKVTGGIDILINQSPWTAILEESNKKNDDKIEVFCGGSLISPKLITTAAHCLWRNQDEATDCPEQFRNMKTTDECHNRRGGCPIGCRRLRPQDINVYLGITSITKQDRRPLSVETIHIHELWDKSELSDRKNVLVGNDIAILQLSKEQSFTAKIRPVCLPDQFVDVFEVSFRNATIDGFGYIERGKQKAQRLQRGEIQTWTKDVCNSAYSINLASHQLCAGSNGVDSCRGDSGGGLTTLMEDPPNEKYVLIGITSFGVRFCGADNKPSIYTNVLSHMDWIQTTISRLTEAWGPWTACSATCGPGVMQRRSAKCAEDDYDYDPRVVSVVDLRSSSNINENCLDIKECFNSPCRGTNIMPETQSNIGRILLVGGYVGASKQSNRVFLQECHYATFEDDYDEDLYEDDYIIELRSDSIKDALVEDVNVPSFPVNISLSTGQVLEDTVYICGGFNQQFQSQRHCFKFTVRPGEQWEEGPRLITPRANAAMISTKTGLWITGGRNGPINFLDSTEFFNKSTGAWVNGHSLTQKLGLHCALSYETEGGESMIIIGGSRFDDRLDDFIRIDTVESYDLTSGESTPLPSLRNPRSSHSCLPGDHNSYQILVAGGKTSRRERLSSVEYFEAGASRWVYLAPLPYYISGASFVLQNSLPLLIGGIISESGTQSERSNPNDVNKFSDKVYAYDLDGDKWKEVGKVAEGVAFNTAVALPDRLCGQTTGDIDGSIFDESDGSKGKFWDWVDLRNAG